MRKILFITATHGNEQDGTKVMQRLEQELPKEDYGYDWIIANEKAYAINERFVEQDLNRSAPGDINSPVYEVRRAAEIIDMSKNYDVVIDLHGTKTDSGMVTIIPYPTKQNVALAQSTGLNRNVVWYSETSNVAGPLVQHMSIPAIEFECGPRDTDKAFDLTYTAVRRFIEANREGVDVEGVEKVEFYNVYDKLPGEHDSSLEDFVMTTRGGESFYPFLSGNEYGGIVCYKMNKIDASDIVLV
ncbi:MAG: succinylglutamate desuccinylase/aspartoacylase family protein [Candidatus Microsaccharimonas sp.]